MSREEYSNQVFINCPIDDDFWDLFQAFCFTILDCGFVPRCSLEIDDASQFRLKAIIDMIENCKYGLHDLSRVQLDKKNKLPRFNMPFEFGIFYSSKVFGNKKHKNKQCIVMEKEKYRYQKFMSDISGFDVTPHNHSVKKAIFALRNWLVTASQRTSIPPAENICSRHLKFQRDLKRICKNRGISHRAMPFIESVQNMTDWLKVNQMLKQPLFAKKV